MPYAPMRLDEFRNFTIAPAATCSVSPTLIVSELTTYGKFGLFAHVDVAIRVAAERVVLERGEVHRRSGRALHVERAIGGEEAGGGEELHHRPRGDLQRIVRVHDDRVEHVREVGVVRPRRGRGALGSAE